MSGESVGTLIVTRTVDSLLQLLNVAEAGAVGKAAAKSAQGYTRSRNLNSSTPLLSTIEAAIYSGSNFLSLLCVNG